MADAEVTVANTIFAVAAIQVMEDFTAAIDIILPTDQTTIPKVTINATSVPIH